MMMAPKMVAADGASRKRSAQMPQDGRDGVTATPSTNPGAGICNLQSNVPGGPGTTPWIAAGFRIAEPSSRVDPFSGSRQRPKPESTARRVSSRVGRYLGEFPAQFLAGGINCRRVRAGRVGNRVLRGLRGAGFAASGRACWQPLRDRLRRRLPSGEERRADQAEAFERLQERRPPGPVTGEMQENLAPGASQAARHRERPATEPLGGDQHLPKPQPADPPRHVVSHHVERQPGGVVAKAGQDPSLRDQDAIFDLRLIPRPRYRRRGVHRRLALV